MGSRNFSYIRIDTKDAEAKLKDMMSTLSEKQIVRASYLAMNQTMAKERTVLRQYVRHTYNIPGKYIQGISFKKATSVRLFSTMSAPSKSLPIALFNPRFESASFVLSLYKNGGRKGEVKQTKGKSTGAPGVSFEIIKGQTQNIPFAFMTPKYAQVFARGKYQQAGRGFVIGKERYPISSMVTASVYKAAFGSKVADKVKAEAGELYITNVGKMIVAMSKGYIKDSKH